MIRLALASLFIATCLAPATLAQEGQMTPRPDVRLEALPERGDARQWANEGRTTVINLLTEPEMEALGFDYASSVMESGMIYANVPVGRMTGTEAADAVARILADADGPVVINCGTATRASHVYAASLIRSGEIERDALHTIDPEREWNEALLDRLLGETDNAESAQ